MINCLIWLLNNLSVTFIRPLWPGPPCNHLSLLSRDYTYPVTHANYPLSSPHDSGGDPVT